ncbi:MAG: hypothetical protein AB1348_09045 [Nitrospirota bacterium]
MTQVLQPLIKFKGKIFCSLIGSSSAATGIALSQGCQWRSCNACYGCIAGGSIILGFAIFKRLTTHLKGGKKRNNGVA